MQTKAWLTEAHKRKLEKEKNEKNKQQKELLTLIDEEDVNAVYKRRHPEPPAYNNSGATSGL